MFAGVYKTVQYMTAHIDISNVYNIYIYIHIVHIYIYIHTLSSV